MLSKRAVCWTSCWVLHLTNSMEKGERRNSAGRVQSVALKLIIEGRNHAFNQKNIGRLMVPLKRGQFKPHGMNGRDEASKPGM